MKKICLLLLGISVFIANAQQKYDTRFADNQDGTFTNPVLFSDYPDVDIIRVGTDYYMICSSFQFMPGIPISHSKDLINWDIIGYAYDSLNYNPGYSMKGGKTMYRGGSWAPCIRYFDKQFHIFFNDNNGGFVSCVSNKPEGPYQMIRLGKDLYDPGVLCDDDGRIYVAHGQRVIYISELSKDFRKIITPPKMVFNSFLKGFEGSHFYKRNGYYYICNTAQGGNGIQFILRSKHVYGPYERRMLLTTDMNYADCGLHQGGFVDLPNGDSWFFLFRDHQVVGRTPVLFPIKWINDWPELVDQSNSGRVAATQMLPLPDIRVVPHSPEQSDEFDTKTLNLHWQWNHNPDNTLWSLSERPGFLRLHAPTAENFLKARNSLGRRIIGPQCSARAKLDLTHLEDGDVAGICILQNPYSFLGVSKIDGKYMLRMLDNGKEIAREKLECAIVYCNMNVDENGMVSYSYSIDNHQFTNVGTASKVTYANYVGARMGLFCFHQGKGKSGYADIDYFRLSSKFGGPANHFSAFKSIPINLYDNEYGTRLERLVADRPLQKLRSVDDGAWIQYNHIDFAAGANTFQVFAAPFANQKGFIEIRKDRIDGELLGTCPVQADSELVEPHGMNLEPSKQAVPTHFSNYITPIKNTQGIQKIYLVFKGGSQYLFDIQYFSFYKRSPK